ncbi:hypothetical protein EJ04DRAFT_548332 [Polyplosphaeria fusca]|uniref:Uncharacterized protein n=1 Tax=Polyplosphaeria fusca TaxID=682080 RepID=A0A9P4V7E8_9PLEO|nr:hypothetical protein EJ04DRAFT_548332 [Polyplosphaeria fusca]
MQPGPTDVIWTASHDHRNALSYTHTGTPSTCTPHPPKRRRPSRAPFTAVPAIPLDTLGANLSTHLPPEAAGGQAKCANRPCAGMSRLNRKRAIMGRGRRGCEGRILILRSRAMIEPTCGIPPRAIGAMSVHTSTQLCAVSTPTAAHPALAIGESSPTLAL